MKNCQRLENFAQSGEISPNLVTLVLTIKCMQKIGDQRPTLIMIDFCSKVLYAAENKVPKTG